MAPIPKNIKQSLVAVLLILAAAVYALIGIARPPHGTSITNEAVSSYLFKTGQRMVARSNMTETIVQSASIATIIDLHLSAEALVGNGVDSCQVTARVFDASGNPVPDGQPVEFTTTAGRFSNGHDTTYTLTVGGAAIAWLRSDALTSSQPVWVRIGASTMGASGQSLTRFLPVVFYAAALKGTIASASGRTVQGMIVVAYDQNQSEAGRDTTRADGEFLIPVSQSGMYRTAFRYINAFGDDITVYANRHVAVPASGGDAAVSPLCTIVGNILDVASGNALRRSQIQVMLYKASSNRDNGGRSLPAMGMTDERGVFAFDSLSSGDFEMHVMDVQFSGRTAVQQVSSGMFLIDANIRLVDAPAMEITKTSNKRIAEIGDVVTYTVHVRNISQSSPLINVRLIDDLPVAFVFAGNSARRDSVALPDPASKRKPEWMIADSLRPGGSVTVTYSVTIGSAALDGNGINKAYAVGTDAAGREQRSIEATAQVTVRPGVFSDRGVVLGKVFYDENENAQQDDGERGIPRVELWMEDGTRIITGDDGKYSLPEVRAGQHVMRVNDLTLPFGAKVLALKAESAEDGISRFVRLTEGGIARTDFYVKPPGQASAEVSFTSSYAKGAADRIPSVYVLRFGEIDAPTKISLADTLPGGFSYDYKSISWRGMQLYPQGVMSNVLAIDFQKRAAQSTDSIHVDIVADSAAAGKLLESRGRLLLGYPRNRDALFPIAQKYQEALPRFAESVVSVEQKAEPEKPVDSAKAEVQPVAKAEEIAVPEKQPDVIAEQDTKRAVKSKSATSAAKKVSTKRARKIAPGAVDTSRAVIADTLRTPLDTSRLRELLGDEGSLVRHENNVKLLQVAGIIASAILLFALLFLSWRRRKKDDGGEQ